ncbi:alpha/beta fold hydrolase [Alteromonas sp. C1M14]|uniref:alpha/beta fold hydrolase n=1 Tax=Alteromonas sp. C1M14 TaxID=2841567 RepID=UPI001C097020|nr:alpha/beta fold hydrolase [Alteromonas sp. C1M14]MBU2978884.1 alpha/beta fold hydrolase [Alteromonas sp. C1M14]
MTFSTIRDDASDAKGLFIFAHGAGAGMSSTFMADMASRLCAQGISVLRFDFPYMQTMTETGKRRPPDKGDKLLSHYLALVREVRKSYSGRLFIGGKSMGGRMATMALDQCDADGALVFGYPFHPPGKPEKLRTDHLHSSHKPMCIIQGERDTFGHQNEVTDYKLPANIHLHFLPDGDHSFKPRKASGYDLDTHISTAATIGSQFIRTLEK